MVKSFCSDECCVWIIQTLPYYWTKCIFPVLTSPLLPYLFISTESCKAMIVGTENVKQTLMFMCLSIDRTHSRFQHRLCWTHRSFPESVRFSKEVGIFKGGGASPQLFWQVPVEALGGARWRWPTGTLPSLGQLQVLHLLGHNAWEMSAKGGM